MQRLTRNLRSQLNCLQSRIDREISYFSKTLLRVSNIIGAFRERCKSEFTEFLVNLDCDLRKVLGPLVPSTVIEESVRYPRISLDSSNASSGEIEHLGPDKDGKPTSDKLNNHINMLVNTLETVAQGLILLLGETNKKYYEFAKPEELGSQLPTPLAAPLPEYFVFNQTSPHKPDPVSYSVTPSHVQGLKEKVNKLVNIGDLTKQQGNVLNSRFNGLAQSAGPWDFDALFKELGIPQSKREDLVFKLIHTGIIAVEHKTKNDAEKTEPNPVRKRSLNRVVLTGSTEKRTEVADNCSGYNTRYSTPRLEKARKLLRPKQLKKRREELKAQAPRSRNELRIRSVTPVNVETKSPKTVKTPVFRKFRQVTPIKT